MRAAGRLAVGVHGAVRPALAEAEAAARALALAELAAAPVYIVHVSCAAALAHIRLVAREGRPAGDGAGWGRQAPRTPSVRQT